jgi:hypothetical protein
MKKSLFKDQRYNSLLGYIIVDTEVSKSDEDQNKSQIPSAFIYLKLHINMMTTKRVIYGKQKLSEIIE